MNYAEWRRSEGETPAEGVKKYRRKTPAMTFERACFSTPDAPEIISLLSMSREAGISRILAANASQPRSQAELID
ncbi:MAG: hypothetical protein U1F27_13595 [Turneriella sp.]